MGDKGIIKESVWNVRRDNPFCDVCEEDDCLIGVEEDCSMIRAYKEYKRVLTDIERGLS